MIIFMGNLYSMLGLVDTYILLLFRIEYTIVGQEEGKQTIIWHCAYLTDFNATLSLLNIARKFPKGESNL